MACRVRFGLSIPGRGMFSKRWKQADGKRIAFGFVFGAILLVTTLAGIELLSSFFVPPWPARALNPREPAQARVLSTPFRGQSWLADPDNSWGMRDHERARAKRPEAFRAI